MLDYLDGLREQLSIRPICLILDQYGTHEMDNFKAKAQSLGTFLLWIPKRGTEIYQPLDRRVYAALQAKGRAKWRIFYFEHNRPCYRANAGSLFVESWLSFQDLQNSSVDIFKRVSAGARSVTQIVTMSLTLMKPIFHSVFVEYIFVVD
jgi:hypothetical protein